MQNMSDVENQIQETTLVGQATANVDKSTDATMHNVFRKSKDDNQTNSIDDEMCLENDAIPIKSSHGLRRNVVLTLFATCLIIVIVATIVIVKQTLQTNSNSVPTQTVPTAPNNTPTIIGSPVYRPVQYPSVTGYSSPTSG